MSAAYLNEAGAQAAVGALRAQQVVEAVKSEQATTDRVWLTFIEIAARDGWKSPGCRSFLLELAKRAAAR